MSCARVGVLRVLRMLRMLRLLGLLFALSLSGCAANPFVKTTYVETVQAVTLTRDRQIIVVLGADNDYIFNAPPALGQVLATPLRGAARAELFGFHVQQGERITGGYALQLDPGAATELQLQAAQLGFAGPAGGPLVLRGELIGNRHPKFPHPPAVAGPPAVPYAVTITSNAGPRSPPDPSTQPPSQAAVAARVLLAPVLIPIALTQVCLICK
jgi:hypothetical protein